MTAPHTRCDLEELEKLATAAMDNPGFMDESNEDDEGRWSHRSGATREMVAFDNAASPVVLLEIVRRLREAEAIGRDLADRPGFNAGFFNCAWCHEGGRNAMSVDMFDAKNHHESCPYRRAVAATRRESGKQESP